MMKKVKITIYTVDGRKHIFKINFDNTEEFERVVNLYTKSTWKDFVQLDIRFDDRLAVGFNPIHVVSVVIKKRWF
jgi:hypothetical protein